MAKKRKKVKKKKVREVAGSGGIMFRLKRAEVKFLLEEDRPSPIDVKGLEKFAAKFKSKFGVTRYSSLGVKSAKGLYIIANQLRHRKIDDATGLPIKKEFKRRKKKKKTRKKTVKKTKGQRKVHRYTPAEKRWLKKQDKPDYDSPEMAALADNFNALFASANPPKVTPTAVYERQAVLKGLRKSKGPNAKKKKGKNKKHIYTPREEEIIAIEMCSMIPDDQPLRKGLINKLRRRLKKKYGLNVSFNSLRPKCCRLRKETKDGREILVPSVKISASKAIRVAAESVPPIAEGAKGDYFVIDVADPNGPQIIWTGDHNPGKPNVLSGISQDERQVVECAVKIDGRMLEKVFIDHRPELRLSGPTD